ncbi:MAG: thioredoxin [Zoogloeaceae bacterium]|jgi:thioredoxin 1|nr:thioredoxin [Zoogloeaceae bacterium]
MSSESITPISDDNFETEVLSASIPVLVDFWAEWCGPCKAMMPIVENIARKYSGKIRVGKINVDEERDLAARYNIRGIPTLMLFCDGNVEEIKVGAQSESQIASMIDSRL